MDWFASIQQCVALTFPLSGMFCMGWFACVYYTDRCPTLCVHHILIVRHVLYGLVRPSVVCRQVPNPGALDDPHLPSVRHVLYGLVRPSVVYRQVPSTGSPLPSHCQTCAMYLPDSFLPPNNLDLSSAAHAPRPLRCNV